MDSMTASDPHADRPTQDGDLYVYADEDISRVCGEVYSRLQEFDDLDDTEAEAICNMLFDMLTGDWLQQDT